MKTVVLTLLACAVAAPALAQEPAGCDKFKWPLDKERATLTGTDLPKLSSGERAPWPVPFAAIVGLSPFAAAKLPMAPQRPPKPADAFAGFVMVAGPSHAGTYKVTLSSEGWIDIVQDGRLVKSSGFTGATGCTGIRKSVKFELAAKPFVVELSGVSANAASIAITPD